MLEKLELSLYRKALHVVAVTDAFKSNLISRGIPQEKISVVKNSVDLEFFRAMPSCRTLIEELRLEGKFVVSYIGTIGMAHAVDTIVEAAELLKNNEEIVFLIVGEGAHKQKIRALAEKKSLTNIRILPGVTKEKVKEFYSITHLSLVTLQKKPLFKTVIPSKIFEIMAMGHPILTTVDGESRRIIEEASSGVFVEPENAAELAATVLNLSKSASLEQMGLRGISFVQNNFSRDELANSLLRLFQRLIKN